MNNKKKGAALGGLLLLGALTLGAASPASADNSPIISDGDFGGTALPYVNVGALPPGTQFGAWKVDQGTAYVCGGTGYCSTTAITGYGVILTPIQTAISQTFPTTVGATYVIAYDLLRSGNATSQIDVTVDGVNLSSELATSNNVTKQFSFVATGASTTIKFAAYTSDFSYSQGGSVLSNVRGFLTSAPGPIPLVAPAIGAAAGGVALLAAATVFLIRRRRTEVADGSVA